MNIKYPFFLAFMLVPILILAQSDSKDEFPNFNGGSRKYQQANSNFAEIDITKLKKGYWLAENQPDSVYLNVESSKCYYYHTSLMPREAKMTAKLAHISADKPQKFISEEMIEIQFDYLDTLPAPHYASEWNRPLSYGDQEPKVFLFKRLTPEAFIIEERDSLKRTFVFHKLQSEKPLFQQMKIEKLKEIEKKLSGLWVNKENGHSVLMGKAYMLSEYFLKFSPELSLTSVSFLPITQDSIKAEKTYTDVQWCDNSEFVLSDFSENWNRYKINKLNETNLILTNDSMKIHDEYTKTLPYLFSDSILRGLRDKVWCDTMYNEYERRVDTLAFDFGETSDKIEYKDSFLKSYGHCYNGGLFHSDAFIDFFSFKNHHYFIKTTHGSITLSEIISLSPEHLKIRTQYENDKVKVTELFLHPQNSEYFKDGHRLQY